MSDSPAKSSGKDWNEIVSEATLGGTKSAAITTAFFGPAVYFLNKHHTGFRTRLGFSGKAATVMIPAVFAFWSESQFVAIRARTTLIEHEAAMSQLPSTTPWVPTFHGLPIHHAAANWLYDHPFAFISTVGGSAVGSIFALEKIRHPEMSLSSRVMHTRVCTRSCCDIALWSYGIS
eukprot:c3981_g1_i2.p1 GENE.c3981_g1_i2~~c3981_g1_i2.p1  ORF type:complete len:191 (+),score=25.08 c3981_g1_i2:48-575(+)